MKHLALAILMLLIAAALPAAAATLSVRTADGLVVVHGQATALENLRAELARNMPPGAANAQLLQHIFQNHANTFEAAAYTSEQAGLGQADVGSPTVLETTVREAERSGFVPAITGKELFEAYMLIQMRGDSFKILGDPPQGAIQTPRDIFVFSSSYGSEISGIYVDGKKIVPETDFWTSPNGYKIIAMDPDTGAVLATAEFPTFSDPDSGAKMADFLNAQPDGALVAGAVKWGPGVFLTGSAIDAMWQYGAAADPDPELHMAHAFIGRRGLATGQALEAVAVQDSCRLVLFSPGTYISRAAAGTLSPAPGSRIIAVRGTGPGDTILIIGREY